MFNAYRDFLIIRTNALFNTFTGARGINGMPLDLSVPYFVLDGQIIGPADEQGRGIGRHTKIFGEVVSVPKMLSHIKIHQDPQGLPSYITMPTFHYRWLDDIVPEVEVGDRIYFNYKVILHALTHNDFVKIEGERENKVYYIKVRYDKVYCAVRNGKIIPIQGYTFLDPAMETWESISVPTPVFINGKALLDKNGQPVMKPKDQWMLKKLMPDYEYLRGYVRAVGTPLNRDKCELEVGDTVLYKQNRNWPQKVEGKDYFFVLQRDILGKFVTEAA